MRLYMPTKVFFGSGCVSENGAELKALGSRAMIVTGKHSSRINGSLAAVEQALQANGQTYVIFDEIEENPSVETVAVAAGIAVKEQVDFFVAVGGGSPMDASKAISLLAANPSAIDHAEERLYHPEPMQGYPVAAVPTTSGTGSEVTPYAILTRHDLHTKQSIAHKWFADLAFVDAGYLKTSSYENMVSTCVDALAHLIESYLNTNANAYNRIYSAEGLRIWGSAKEYLLSSEIKIPDEGYETFMHGVFRFRYFFDLYGKASAFLLSVAAQYVEIVPALVRHLERGFFFPAQNLIDFRRKIARLYNRIRQFFPLALAHICAAAARAAV